MSFVNTTPHNWTAWASKAHCAEALRAANLRGGGHKQSYRCKEKKKKKTTYVAHIHAETSHFFATLSNPSGADRGHTFINQNCCHATKQNLCTRVDGSLPSLSNRWIEVQLGQQALLPSQGLWTGSYGHACPQLHLQIPLGRTQVETHRRQWDCTSLWQLNSILSLTLGFMICFENKME